MLNRHAERLAFIEREVPEKFRDLARATLPHVLVGRLEELPRLEQNALLRDINEFEGHDPPWAGDFIEMMLAEDKEAW